MREHTTVTSASSEVLQLLHEVDREPVVYLTEAAWNERVDRANAVYRDLVELSDARIDRDDAQDAAFFVQFTRWTAAAGESKPVFSLRFSMSGNLVCLAKEPDIANDNDLAVIERCPELLRRHGFLPIAYEQLQDPYTGTSYEGKQLPEFATWHWRFFDFQ